MSSPRIHTSEFPPVETPSTPIHEAVLASAAARGDHPALVDGVTGQTITYAQLAQMVHRMAAGFAEIGVRPGDVVALHSPNTVLYPVVFYAASRAGATVTTLSALTTAEGHGQPARRQQGDRWSSPSARSCRWPSRRPATGRCGRCDQVEGHRCVQELLASTGAGARRRHRPRRGRRRAAVLLRHHQPAQGRDAHPRAASP